MKLKHFAIALFSVLFCLGPAAIVAQQISGGGGGGTPGGSTTQVQFNDAGAFAGDAGLVWDKTNNLLSGVGTLGATGSGSTGTIGFDSGGAMVLFGRTDVDTRLVAVGWQANAAVSAVVLANDGIFAWSSASHVDGGNGNPDTGTARNAAGVTEFNNGRNGTFREAKLRSLIVGGTVPGISGCSAGTQTGGGTAGTYASGTTGVCTVTLTFAFTAPTGWNCSANNQTTANLIRQTGGSTTTAVIAGTTVSGDVVSFGCMAY